MPKMKTHSGTKKRVRLTGSGKLIREQVGGRHLFEKMSSRKKRRIASNQIIAPADTKRIKKLLGK
jgi:large subunit ribosomal protein L35